MSQVLYGELGDTFAMWAALNNTSGSGDDGATPICRVRKAGDAASGAPTYSPTPALLTHANYQNGAYEILIPATTGNGFVLDGVYGVFFTATVSAQNPLGVVGSITLGKLQTAKDLGVLLETTIASVITQLAITTAEGSDANDEYTNCQMTIEDTDNPLRIARTYPVAYVGSSRTFTLALPTTTFTAAIGDRVRVYKDTHAAVLASAAAMANVQARLPTTLNNGMIPADIQRVRNQALQGDGSEANPWRPA